MDDCISSLWFNGIGLHWDFALRWIVSVLLFWFLLSVNSNLFCYIGPNYAFNGGNSFVDEYPDLGESRQLLLVIVGQQRKSAHHLVYLKTETKSRIMSTSSCGWSRLAAILRRLHGRQVMLLQHAPSRSPETPTYGAVPQDC
jgi:hypothetical protein